MTRKEVTKEQIQTIAKIAKRAEKMDLLGHDRMTLMIDLRAVYLQMGLRLDDLLQADDFNFSHDIVGIQNHMNRTSHKIEGGFLPRFADR